MVTIKRLNIFIDESGDFGFTKGSSELYGVSFTIHESDDSIVNVYDAKDVVILKAASVKLTAEELKELKKLEE